MDTVRRGAASHISPEAQRHRWASPAGKKTLWPGGKQTNLAQTGGRGCALTGVDRKKIRFIQRQRMRWDGAERRRISWGDLWEIEASNSNISFIIRATWDVLPLPKNLHQSLGKDAQLQRPSNT